MEEAVIVDKLYSIIISPIFGRQEILIELSVHEEFFINIVSNVDNDNGTFNTSNFDSRWICHVDNVFCVSLQASGFEVRLRVKVCSTLN